MSVDTETRYLTSAQVRHRFGDISPMSLWRWSNNASLAFPQPMKIMGRNLYKESDIIAWEEAQQKAKAS
ncbi:helix-turn-helix transcriptional regulator [Devosia sp. RR2S18]|uniref:helix-turn-helix transcriptional regulator n=1 Tax=Devosia rhizosphaerae TaxID=3049774 RepID=UPI00253FB390|nr:DNA-binding protein [Devosia sp. RR2S18]WIJ26616.1 DNA-binding protein [Devosia sp. RR2S18]